MKIGVIELTLLQGALGESAVEAGLEGGLEG
jgi:hypothetical protein